MESTKPSNEELFERMRSSNPATAADAFGRFCITPGAWWKGNTPLEWARGVARGYAESLKLLKGSPIEKLDGTDWIAHHELLILAKLACVTNNPPARLYVLIKNRIHWTLGDNKEPYSLDGEDVLVDIPDDRDDESIWDDIEFCHRIALGINRLSATLRPYAIGRLVYGEAPHEIAARLGVPQERARQNCRRALQALVGRNDVEALLKMETVTQIRSALSKPDETSMTDAAAVIRDLSATRTNFEELSDLTASSLEPDETAPKERDSTGNS